MGGVIAPHQPNWTQYKSRGYKIDGVFMDADQEDRQYLPPGHAMSPHKVKHRVGTEAVRIGKDNKLLESKKVPRSRDLLEC